MKRQGTARRYAKTLFLAAGEKGALEAVLKDMHFISNVFGSAKELSAFFAGPLTGERRLHSAVIALTKGVGPLTGSFISLLEKKKRLHLLQAIPQAFETLYEKHKNIIRATVISARPLAGPQAEIIKNSLIKSRGAAGCILENIVDRRLLAGFRVRVGDTVINHDLKNRLLRLSKKLAA